jgi:transcription initiation factor TFIIB
MQKSEFPALVERCPECGSSSLIHDYNNGETICTKCGLVTKEPGMDGGPEWRAFTKEEKNKRARAGWPERITIHDKGLPTKISPYDRDHSGGRLSPRAKSQMRRLRKWQRYSRVNSPEERNLAQAMTELDRLADNLNLIDSVKDYAAYIYRKALKKRFIRGREINGVVAAAIYAACRKMEIPIKLEDVENVSSATKRKSIAAYYRALVRKIDISMPIADPLTFVSKIAEKTGISGPAQGVAVRILQRARKKRIVAGKSPLGVAAAVLYIACLLKKEKKTQKEIAEAAGITEVTVRNRYQDLKKGLKLSLETSAPKGVISKSPALKMRITEIFESILEIAGRTGISEEARESAKDIFHQAEEKHVFTDKRRRVNGFAGAILCIACQQTGEIKTQKEIAEAARVPHGTISNYCCYLRWKLNIPRPGRGKYKRAN